MDVHASEGRGKQANESSEDEGCVRYGTEISENPGLIPRPLVEMVSYHQSYHLSFSVPPLLETSSYEPSYTTYVVFEHQTL